VPAAVQLLGVLAALALAGCRSQVAPPVLGDVPAFRLIDVGIFVGSSVSRFVAEAQLKKVFGWFVLVMGSGILLRQML
jgi:uncharacterized membrane protein YfcA